jgi:protein-S-isoprenylcysteine O-methyltransferase Ste14
LIAREAQWHELLALFPSRLPADGSLTLLQPGRLAGLALMLAGTLIRIDCYTRLRRNFTFELAVKSDHKLITDGSYSYVRHPSYTGALLVSLGAFLLNYGRGSFWGEYALPDKSWWVLVGTVDIFLKLVFFVGAVKRCKTEDDVLKAHFEEQWVQWSKKTPYRLLPFVY